MIKSITLDEKWRPYKLSKNCISKSFGGGGSTALPPIIEEPKEEEDTGSGVSKSSTRISKPEI